MPAVVLLPPKRESPSPGVVCLHQTTRIGKDEPAGYGGNDDLHYALELAERGHVTIAPDYPGFGEYQTDPYDLGYQSTTMKGICSHQRAIDVLRSMWEVEKRHGNEPERMPFDFTDILSAVAPRSIFVSAPTGDDNFDNRGVRDIIEDISSLFTRLGAESRLTAVYPQTEHAFPPEIRRRAYDHISRHIGRGDARLLTS